jgi:heme/copper-type cytochrome/quinol oxidase subunit 4
LKKLLAWPVFLGIQAVTSIALLFFIYRLGIMPLKYLIVILVVLALLCALTFFLMKPKGEKETVKNLIGKIVSILLSILMIVGNLYVIRGGNALSKFTNATTQTNSISAIVLKNSSAQTINDLEGKTFGINSSVDEENLEATITELENNIGTVTTKDYKDFET